MTSYKDGIISIPNVTGNIVITASAVQSAPPYTNLADPSSPDWAENSRLSSSGTISAQTGATTTNFVGITTGDVIRVKGIGDLHSYNTAEYDANKVCKNSAKASMSTGSYFTYSYDSEHGIVILTITNDTIKYIRFSGILDHSSADVIITKNEIIE